MSDEKRQRYQFPQTLTEQRRILGIPMDEAIAGMAPLCWGVLTGNHVAGLVMGALFWIGLSRFKKGRGSAWLYNMAYWYLPEYCFKGMFKILPDSAYRLWLK